MKHGELITGWEALHRHPMHNYHIIDKGGRALYCGCMPSIRYNGSYMWLGTNYRSKAHHLEQWYKEYKFERNLERAAEQREKRDNI